MPDHNYPCPGCGEMEDKDCRCTRADWEAVAARERLKDRLLYKPGDVLPTAPVRPAGFEWKIPFDSADYLDSEPIRYQAEGVSDLLAAQSEIRCICKDKPDPGCPLHGVQTIRLTEEER